MYQTGVFLFLERGDDLLRFRFRDTRIVRALDHEKRFGDFLRVVQRGDAFHECGHFRIALIAILGASQIAAVTLRVFQKRGQIGNADNVDRATNTSRRNSSPLRAS